MGAWLQFVYVSERAFPSNILLLEYSFRLEFFIHHSTNMEADDVQMERKGNWMKLKLTNQTRRQTER